MVDQNDRRVFARAADAGYLHQLAGIQLGRRNVGRIPDINSRSVVLDKMREELFIKKCDDAAQLNGDILGGFLNAQGSDGSHGV